MPLTLLDFILIAIMLVSGLLALMRGFTREVLSLVAWGAAAVAAYFAIKQPGLVSWVQASVPYLEKENLAQIAVGASAFLIVLIVVSVISVKISDWVVDSAAGAFDRTLGLVFGVARGFIFVAIAYLFYGWLQPFDRQESWVRNAYSLPMIKSAGEGLLAFMPPDIVDTINDTALATGGDKTPAPDDAAQTDPGYKSNDSQQLDNLMESTGGGNSPMPPASQDTTGNTRQPPQAPGGQDNSQ
ncbi:CvpA family protein [Aestuariivirga sp.]|uniref:CvpA family protein n=1 Tax=Aestuariivirga sp. TaxID=2650926 RepID=UPI0025C3B5A9|nr:CvpA family protein [Aestuariivirga sp.]MCA3554042.1 CvpA family protein [Aestuariivirga sp.]